MSDIAAKLNITVGSLTTSMNSLVKKGYATRERSEQDRRVVFIHLTLKGRKAYHHHAEFHRKMTDAVLDVLTKTKPVLAILPFFLSSIKHDMGRTRLFDCDETFLFFTTMF